MNNLRETVLHEFQWLNRNINQYHCNNEMNFQAITANLSGITNALVQKVDELEARIKELENGSK